MRTRSRQSATRGPGKPRRFWMRAEASSRKTQAEGLCHHESTVHTPCGTGLQPVWLVFAKLLEPCAILLLLAALAHAEVIRVVVLKVDGLPPGLIEQHQFPNLDRIFEKNGVTLDNFYVRGL